jgi:Gametolysin peptidase M11
MIPRYAIIPAWLRIWHSLTILLSFVVLLGLVLGSSASTSFAKPAIPESLAAEQPHSAQALKAEHLTQRLVAVIVQYQGADPAAQVQLLDDLGSVAATRQETLAALMETDPGAVLRVVLPAALRAKLPHAVKDSVEEEVELEGTLEVLHEDRDEGSRFLFFLEAHKTRFTLHFAADPPMKFLTGDRVRVKGVRVKRALALLSGTTSVQTLLQIPPNTFDEQKTLVILVNFVDKAIQPYSPLDASSVVFGTTNDYYQKNSYLLTSLAGDVFGWFTIALNSSVCDYLEIASLADQASAAAGANLAAYTRRIYAFPKNPCTWWGLGTIGGHPSRAWINGSFVLRVVGHELGHNFGDYHSHSLACAGSTCTASEYGDIWDIMGGTTGYFTAFQKERLGWLNYSDEVHRSPPITTVTADGTYWIDPYETNTANPKALKILKATDSTTGKRTWYYVEYRAQLDFDSNLVAGVLIHTGSESSANSSYLWDLDQTTTITDWILDKGQSYGDPAASVTITALDVTIGGAAINVASGPMPCVGANPTVALSPSTTQSALPGTPVIYTVTVTNKDSSSCGDTPFVLSSTLPDVSWTGAFEQLTLTLSPGASGSTSFTVTSPAIAPDGLYTIGVTATNSANASFVGSASVTAMLVSTLDVTVSTDHPSYTSPPPQTITISVTVRFGQTSVAGAAVTFTITRPDGMKVTGLGTTDDNGTAVFRMKLHPKDPAGQWQVHAIANQNGVTWSSKTTFEVQ